MELVSFTTKMFSVTLFCFSKFFIFFIIPQVLNIASSQKRVSTEQSREQVIVR